MWRPDVNHTTIKALNPTSLPLDLHRPAFPAFRLNESSLNHLTQRRNRWGLLKELLGQGLARLLTFLSELTDNLSDLLVTGTI